MEGTNNSAQQSQSQFQETASPSADSDEKITLARKYVQNNEVKEAMTVLSQLLKGDMADQAMCLVADLCKAGFSQELIRSDCITRPLMKHFNRLCRELEENPKAQAAEYGMLKVLCLVSEFIHESPMHRFPFNKKFIANIFLLDAERISTCSKKTVILRVISVILHALSRRIKLIKEYGMLKKLKYTILETYSLVEEVQTLKRLNSAVKNVAAQLPITIGQALKYKLVATLGKFMEQPGRQDQNLVKMEQM